MITYTKFIGKYCIKGTMVDDLDAIIAAAVAAEREACAKVADDLRDYTPEEYDREAHKWLTRAAAAIRARNGAGRE